MVEVDCAQLEVALAILVALDALVVLFEKLVGGSQRLLLLASSCTIAAHHWGCCRGGDGRQGSGATATTHITPIVSPESVKQLTAFRWRVEH